MTRKDIEKAKAENAERIVWHNDTEKTQPGKLLVVKTIYGEYDLCYYGAYALWNTVMTWAYMKDLIPTED